MSGFTSVPEERRQPSALLRLQSAACSLDHCQEEMAEGEAWSCLKARASASSAHG